MVGKSGTVLAGYVHRSTRITPAKPFDRNLHRVREIERLIRYRNADGTCDPSDADADTWLEAAAPDLLFAQGQDAALKWARHWTPGLSIDAVLGVLDIAAARRPLTAGPLGKLLRLTAHERAELGLNSMRAFDRTKRQMTEERKVKHRERQRANRRKAGAIPRSSSLSATKPWEAEGISRRTWERRRGADANSCAPIPYIAAHETASHPDQPRASAPSRGARLAAEDREDDGQAAIERDVRAMLDDLAVEFALSNAEHAAECLSATVSALRTDPEA